MSSSDCPEVMSGFDPPRLLLGRVVAVGAVLRLLIVAATFHSKGADWFFAQASELAVLANSLCSGLGLSSPFGGATGASAFLAPGYPAFVAAVFAVFGRYSFGSAVAIAVMQALFGAASIAALMLLTRRAFGVWAGNAAGWFWALSLPLLWLPVVFWETSLTILMVCSLLATTLWAAETQAARGWLWLGGVAALGMLVNPSLLTLVVCCFGWGWFAVKREQRLRVLAGAALCLVLFAAWPIRNVVVMHAFIPLRSNAGYEAWQGNRVGGDGFFDKTLHLNQNAVEFAEYNRLGEVTYMRQKGALAQAAIAADPGRFARLTAKRVVCFWTGVGPDASAVMIGFSCATLLLGCAGLVGVLRRRRDVAGLFVAPLLLFPLPYYLTHPDYRFRLVVDPLLVALAAYAVSGWMRRDEEA